MSLLRLSLVFFLILRQIKSGFCVAFGSFCEKGLRSFVLQIFVSGKLWMHLYNLCRSTRHNFDGVILMSNCLDLCTHSWIIRTLRIIDHLLANRLLLIVLGATRQRYRFQKVLFESQLEDHNPTRYQSLTNSGMSMPTSTLISTFDIFVTVNQFYLGFRITNISVIYIQHFVSSIMTWVMEYDNLINFK